MRFYETSNVDFFINKRNGWDAYCRYEPEKSWASKSHSLKAPKVMINYRDLDARHKLIIEDQDLYFKNWEKSRINTNACLPVYYSLGERFIKLEHEKPVDFKCKTVPMSLKEVRDKKQHMKEVKRAEKSKKRFAAMLLKECQKKKDVRK